MGEMDIIQIEIEETPVESENPLIDLAIQFGITTVAVIAGSFIYEGIGKLFKDVQQKQHTNSEGYMNE